MDAFARRQRRFMLAAALAWAVLAVAQAVGTAWLCSLLPRTGGSPHMSVDFSWRDSTSGVGCYTGLHCFGCWIVDGLRSSLVAWAVMTLLPILVVPPRRRTPATDCAPAVHTSPYRDGLPAVIAVPDDAARLRARRARRALIAAASVSWLLIGAHWQAVIIGPDIGHARINGVAVLDLLVAVSVVLAYAAAAAWPRPARSPRA
jgi:hypothetical protein